MTTEAKRYKKFFIQFDYTYDTHDSEGHQVDRCGVGHIPNAQEWFTWRFEGLRKLVVPKDEKQTKTSVVGNFLGINHSRDLLHPKKNDGLLKPLHMHVLIMLKASKTQSAMMKFLGISRKKNCDPVKDPKDVSKYELHVTVKAMEVDFKTVYSETELFDWYGVGSLSARQMWHKLVRQTKKEKDEAKAEYKAKALQVALDQRKDEVKTKAILALSERKMTLNEVKEKFYLSSDGLGSTGIVDFVKDKRDLETAQDVAMLKKHEQFKRDGRKLTTIMFSGQGGSGKSTMARLVGYWADDMHEIHATTLERRKTVDIPDGYAGENCSLIDELRPGLMSPESFLTLFDPWQYSLQASRTKNKPFTIETALLTQSEPLERWIFDFCTYDVKHDKSFYFFKSLLDSKLTDVLYMDALQFLEFEWGEKRREVQAMLEEQQSDLKVDTAVKVLNKIYESYVDFYPQVGRRLTYWVSVSSYGDLNIKKWDKESFSFKKVNFEKCPTVPKFSDDLSEEEKTEKLKKARKDFEGLAYLLGVMRPKWVEDLGTNLVEEIADLPF